MLQVMREAEGPGVAVRQQRRGCEGGLCDTRLIPSWGLCAVSVFGVHVEVRISSRVYTDECCVPRIVLKVCTGCVHVSREEEESRFGGRVPAMMGVEVHHSACTYKGWHLPCPNGLAGFRV